jgi:hypothetical protein
MRRLCRRRRRKAALLADGLRAFRYPIQGHQNGTHSNQRQTSQAMAESLSPRKTKATAATSTTLSLSIGATWKALPSFIARK